MVVFYKNISNTFHAKLKHDFTIVLIIFNKGFFAGGRKTNAARRYPGDIFFAISAAISFYFIKSIILGKKITKAKIKAPIAEINTAPADTSLIVFILS